jgi:hypothetical protein
MTTQISTKLAALAVALMLNGLLIGGVAYVFSLEACRSSTITLERGATSACGGVISCVATLIV